MFDENQFYGFLLRGDLPATMEYLKGFPGQRCRYGKYVALFERDDLLRYEVSPALQEILDVYQRYFRAVFYLGCPPEQAEAAMESRFAALFGLEPGEKRRERIKQKITDAFTAGGWQILCGKTGGYYGPYIWKTTEAASYEVELPEGVRRYTIRFLDGFLFRSWLDYISFGEIGTGGWTDGDGIIHCVRGSYDVESESFRVSLLKHEAQHAMDLERYPAMSPGDLEYRAKLVELIYSRERDLLVQFRREADASDPANGHGLAAGRIAAEFGGLSDGEAIRRRARALLGRSTGEMAEKYGGQ